MSVPTLLSSLSPVWVPDRSQHCSLLSVFQSIALMSLTFPWHICLAAREKYLPKCQNLNFSIFFIVCTMPCQGTRPENDGRSSSSKSSSSSGAAHNWRHFSQGASQSHKSQLRRCRRRRSSICARFSNGFSELGVGFAFAFAFAFEFYVLPLPSRHFRSVCVCICVSVCSRSSCSTPTTRALAEISRFSAAHKIYVHPPNERSSLYSSIGGGFRWRLALEEGKRNERNVETIFPFPIFPSPFSFLRKMSRHFWALPS